MTHYDFVPDDSDGWNIRIMDGPYVETLFRYGTLKVTEDGESLSYNADVMYTPDENLTDQDSDFQVVVGEILLDILETQITRENK